MYQISATNLVLGRPEWSDYECNWSRRGNRPASPYVVILSGVWLSFQCDGILCTLASEPDRLALAMLFQDLWGVKVILLIFKQRHPSFAYQVEILAKKKKKEKHFYADLGLFSVFFLLHDPSNEEPTCLYQHFKWCNYYLRDMHHF